MPGTPDYLTLEAHRDAPLFLELVFRWAFAGLLTAFLGLALANAFGQRPATSTVRASTAEVELLAPERLRSGLYYESRFTIRARRELRDAHLVLDRGWIEGITINTVEPSPLGEASRDGRLAFRLGHVPRGDEHVLWLQQQVNPTAFGRREQGVELFDGTDRLLRLSHSATIFP